MIGGIDPVMLGASGGIPAGTITPGTPVAIDSIASGYTSICALTSTTALATYLNVSTNAHNACLLTRSGTTLTPGTPNQFTTTYGIQTSLCMMDSTHAILSMISASQCRCWPIAISGSTISVGSYVDCGGANSYTSICRMSATKAIVCWSNSASPYGVRACCLTRDGNSLTAGTAVSVNALQSTSQMGVSSFDDSNAVVVFREISASSIKCAPLSLSGSTITPGSVVTIISSGSDLCSGICLSATKALASFYDGSVTRGKSCDLTLSGGSITAGTPIIWLTRYAQYNRMAQMTSTQALITVTDVNNSNYATGSILTLIGATLSGSTPTTIHATTTAEVSVATFSPYYAVLSYVATNLPSSNSRYPYATCVALS
jgi:hypothetical protein